MTQGAVLECLGLSVALILFWICDCLLLAPFSQMVYFTAGFLVTFVVLAWKRFNSGMHPVFFFLSLLLLFQGGRLLAFCFGGGTYDSFSIDLADTPFQITDAQQRLTLLLILISALCVYVPQRLFNVQLRYAAPTDRTLTPYFLILFTVCFPFHVYKNYAYLAYVRSHGGYLAILQSQEHISDVGLTVRIFSQLCSAAFVAYFAFEQPRRRLWMITAAYCSVSIMELLIGMRGKVLLFFLGLLLLGKLKRNSKFKLETLVVLAFALMLVAEATAIFRENKEAGLDLLAAPKILLSTQGVSINVLESVVAYRPQFEAHSLSYLKNGLLLGFKQPDVRNEHWGEIFEDDLSYFLNPSAFSLGFGTGGAYLAEGYVAGGTAGIILESLLISVLLTICTKYMRGNSLPFAWSIAVALLYLPREDLSIAFSGEVRSCFSLACVCVLALGMRLFRNTLLTSRPSKLTYAPNMGGE